MKFQSNFSRMRMTEDVCTCLPPNLEEHTARPKREFPGSTLPQQFERRYLFQHRVGASLQCCKHIRTVIDVRVQSRNLGTCLTVCMRHDTAGHIQLFQHNSHRYST